MFPERFSNLPAYAFPRLRALLDVHEPGGDVLHMTIGEPKHAFPSWITQIISQNAAEFGIYPANDGTPELQAAICGWLARRYGVTLDPDNQVVALNGTREGLYNAMMALCPETKAGARPVVLVPNPFYQVYMVAALSVGAEPVFVPATRETGYLPDFNTVPDEVMNRVAVVYLCSPSNPQGAVATAEYWQNLLSLAEKHDFKIFADECYSEIYRDTPPEGALAVAARTGADPERVIAFHSLSKRSNLPGLRSGFVAGGPESIRRIKQLRAYTGAPLSAPLQRVSEAVWADDAHVEESRRLYCEKYARADEIMHGVPGYQGPEAGFFLWLPVENGEAAALHLWQQTGVRVLPGAYLSQKAPAGNPGKGYIRVAMVAPIDEMSRGLTRLRDCLYS
ncbi:aminotransferase class I/II-fold pyridoxal phosphate-dependent enzyme [Roseovarius pelagicus]|uniref:Aminotransferase class I/II-fold pyridoxal phosphate-dependent enzyme n=1 Tax=Roseovarius pelagicus TaxID=2980108 RepID=A0ABY6DJQ9_9RHOB|nr:aminotransferase class I/II-fold pyridoxal phosphate-dependent enzyme [Roseovarius pelagicus]UXX85183.1 aminotransferase class I/II-fold pyridoxal phosphate-dependent enzyme [Roseovarius pelagicus]